MTSTQRLSLVTLVLWAAFGLALARLNTTSFSSLTAEEGWTVYAVRAPAPASYEPPRGRRARLMTPVYAARDDLLTTVRRAREAGVPPLYAVTLDAWTFFAGEGVFALRYLPLLLGLPGVATVYVLARRWWDERGALLALLLVASSPWWMTVPLTHRNALLFTLVAAATLAYTRLVRYPALLRMGFYGLLAALVLYTHPAALLVLLAHGLHGVFNGRGIPWAVSAVAAGLLYGPWLWLSGWSLLLPDGHWLAALLLVGLGGLALAVAYGLRVLPEWGALIAVALLATLQVNAYAWAVPPPPCYPCATAAITALRDPFTPVITDIPAAHPLRYHSQQMQLTRGTALDLSWRSHSAEEIRGIMARFANVPVVWVVMPVDGAQTEAATHALVDQGRVRAYYQQVGDMAFYGFESAP